MITRLLWALLMPIVATIFLGASSEEIKNPEPTKDISAQATQSDVANTGELNLGETNTDNFYYRYYGYGFPYYNYYYPYSSLSYPYYNYYSFPYYGYYGLPLSRSIMKIHGML